MFSFLKKRLRNEHMKLIFQNQSALDYLRPFVKNGETDDLQELVRNIQTKWKPGEVLEKNDANDMLNTNRRLRRLYDQTPAAYLKTFDEEFKPLLGWDEYFSRYRS